MSDTKDDIESLKTQLSGARQRRSNLLQYEGLAKNVNKHPDRPQLRKRQRDAEDELQRAEADAAEVESNLAQRRQQFSLLMTTIADLENMYTLESGKVASATAAAASQQQAEEGELQEDSSGSGAAGSPAADAGTPAAQAEADADSDGDATLK